MASVETRQERDLRRKQTPVRPADPVLEVEGGKPLEEWDGGISKRTLSFYHAEGAPYLDDDGKLHAQPPAEEMEELQRQGLAVPPTILEEIVGEVVPIREDVVLSTVYPAKAPRSPAKSQPLPPEERRAERAIEPAPPAAQVPGTRLKEPTDFSGIEELAFLALKTVFPGGVKIPIRKEGLANLDVIIKGKEIFIDVKGPLADVPALSVWRITFAFEGEPLMIYGRGVKGDIQVYRFRVLRFLWRAWRAKSKRKKLARRQSRDDWGVLARSKVLIDERKGGQEE